MTIADYLTEYWNWDEIPEGLRPNRTETAVQPASLYSPGCGADAEVLQKGATDVVSIASTRATAEINRRGPSKYSPKRLHSSGPPSFVQKVSLLFIDP